MAEKNKNRGKKYILITDEDGNTYVCPRDALKDPEELTEEEKANCIGMPTHGPGE